MVRNGSSWLKLSAKFKNLFLDVFKIKMKQYVHLKSFCQGEDNLHTFNKLILKCHPEYIEIYLIPQSL